jgi:hypothetical protein
MHRVRTLRAFSDPIFDPISLETFFLRVRIQKTEDFQKSSLDRRSMFSHDDPKKRIILLSPAGQSYF